MKNWKFIVITVFLSTLLLACKGSKCDCPSFKPKSEIIKESSNYAKQLTPQRALLSFAQA